MKVDYDPIIFVQQESVDMEEFIIGTYYVEMETADYLKRAGALAVEQTTGTWLPVPEETLEVRKAHVGRLIAVHPIPNYEQAWPTETKEKKCIIQLAFPWKNIGQQIPELLSTVIGNISMAGKLKLLDLQFPKSWTQAFQGPRFGVPGLRKLIGEPEEPLLLGMIKPCTGIPPATIGKVFYQLAVAGLEMIKDDELIADPAHAPWEARLEAVLEARERAYKETGKYSLYFLNVTDRQDKMLAKAKKAVKLGCPALMVNVHATGYGTIQMLAEDPEINVPILSHSCYAGTIVESPYTGISSHLALGKLQRLDGADIVCYPTSYGKLPLIRERYIRSGQCMLSPFHHLKPNFPLPAAGIHPGMVPVLMRDLGTDLIIGAGGAMHGHPMGPAAGIAALRQAVRATMKGISLQEAASTQKELKAALDAWGDYSSKSIFELLQ